MFISNQYLSARPKWSILRKRSNSKRRATRTWNHKPSRPRKISFFSKPSLKNILKREKIEFWVRSRDLHWARGQEAWKLDLFLLQQSNRTELSVSSHQRSHNPNTAGTRLGVDPATEQFYQAQKEKLVLSWKKKLCGAKPEPLQWSSMVEKEKSWVQ